MNRQFPPEIVQLIVEASMDPVVVSGLDTAQIYGRYSILKRHSVLNSTWNGVCKPSLYGTVVVKSEMAASSFGYTAERDGDAMGLVTSMIIGCEGWYNRRPVAVIKHVPRLRRLALWSASVHAQDFVNMHHLTDVILSHCTISIPSPSNRLSIRHLRIDSRDDCKAIGALLSPDIIPKLEQLDLKLEYTRLGSMEISWLAPQLSALQLEIAYHVERCLFDHESLRLLSLSYRRFDLTPLTTLPPFCEESEGTRKGKPGRTMLISKTRMKINT